MAFALALTWGLAWGCANSQPEGSPDASAGTDGRDPMHGGAPADADSARVSPSAGRSPDAATHAADAGTDAAERRGNTPMAGAGMDAASAAPDSSDGCQCSFEACPPDSQRIALPDECCPVCQPCAEVECPDIVCDVGQEPLIPTGQCCATACKRSDVDPEAYGAVTLGAMQNCEAAERPVCNGNGWPGCAYNWEDAMTNYRRSCPAIVGPYLARCEHHDAIINVDEYSLRVFLFDRDTGRLAGFQLIGEDGPLLCQAYEAGFAAEAQSCEPLTVGCSPDDVIPPFDAGVSLPWEPDSLPSCEQGQSDYDAFLQAQLDEYNLCSDDSFCATGGPPGILGPDNPCQQPCNMVLSPQAINSNILNRLDTFGRAACARCAGVTQPQCPFLLPTSGRCIDGHCTIVAP